ncbi:UDP-galactopyranose mutase, partial [Candidatus Saganbacteria bacterium]|nr:UDP-galactopyranose mutase [Candidatus Saganbacteria bacterium]
KQWGMLPEELDSRVLERVPLWTDRDNRYFKDKHQGMPGLGYAKMIERMLAHPNIEIVLNRDYKHILSEVEFGKMIYTGPLDYFFDYKYGKLPYRSLRFEFETLNQEWFQEAAVINYPGDELFTRVTEFKRMTGQAHSMTTILREYPKAHVPEENIPCYPIPKKENFERYRKYKEEADKLPNVIFIGRLAEYRYYNMDEAVERAMRAVA